jgi:hypothetical protein
MRQSLVFFLFLALLLPACEMDDYDLDEQATDSLTRCIPTTNICATNTAATCSRTGRTSVAAPNCRRRPIPSPTSANPFRWKGGRQLRHAARSGINVIRLLTIWEAVEPYASGEYDEEYLDYLEQIVAKAGEYGIYCLIDMHQDGFSRWNRKYFIDDTPGSALEDFSGHETDAGPTYTTSCRVTARRCGRCNCYCRRRTSAGRNGVCRDRSFPTRTKPRTSIRCTGASAVRVAGRHQVLRHFFQRPQYLSELLCGRENIQDYLQNSYANAWRQIAGASANIPMFWGTI